MCVGKRNLLLPLLPASLELLLIISSDTEIFWQLSSRPQLFYKKGALQNFANFHLCRSLILNKIVDLKPPS